MTLDLYLMKRRFFFLHLYSGPQDPLGSALSRAARRHKMKVTVESFDRDRDGVNLLAEEPYSELLDRARRGLWDGFHAGFPCTSFSKLRWREMKGYPGPCRSRRHPYGLPSNTQKLQEECDQGTLHASRSIMMGEVILNSRPKDRIKPAVTVENPPPSDHAHHCSAWELPEVDSAVEKMDWTKVNFTTCHYQRDVAAGQRTYKPQMFAGSLLGLGSLAGSCPCGDADHIPVIGKQRSVSSGHFPQELCDKYAELVIQHFRRLATAEFYAKRESDLKKEVEELRGRTKREASPTPERGVKGEHIKTKEEEKLQAKADSAATSKSKAKPKEEDEYTYEYETEDDGDTKVEVKAEQGKVRLKPWAGGGGNYGMLKESKSKGNNPANLNFVGGMRNPVTTVAGMPGALNLGMRILASWERFYKSNRLAGEAAAAYGTPDCKLDEATVDRWKVELRRLVGSQGKRSVKLQSRWRYRSPLESDLIRAWTRKAGDPDTDLADWVDEGTPLGVNLDIKPKGVFPPADKEGDPEVMMDASLQIARGAITNYISITDNLEDSKEEIRRLLELGYVMKVSKEQVDEHFSQGTISKLAIIVKTRPDGTRKRRLIIDLRRSGGNSKARLDEKIVLSRAMDAVEMARAMHQLHPQTSVEEQHGKWSRELTLIDIADAFPHLPVHEKELEHTLTPDIEGDGFLLFRALLFGFRTAPLLWSRMAAWTSRMLQSCLPQEEAQHQTYLDDSLWALQGTLARRNLLLGFVLHTMSALGFKLSVGKGERGASVTWAGVEFRLLSETEILVTLPEKFIVDLQGRLKEWENRGMAPIAELRTVTGKLSWLSGILPRTKWILRVFYAVLADREEEVRSGKESTRREGRADSRNKSGLFVVKRLEGPRLALMEYLNVTKERPSRKISLTSRNKAKVALITDASPEGLGAVLVINDQVIDTVASPVTEGDAKGLGFEWGASSSQGVVEALAIIMALQHWGNKLAGMNVVITIQSDSVTALSTTLKKSGASPAQNFCGAVLGVLLERYRVEDAKLQHIPGVANKVADYLSRPSTWKDSPRPPEIKEASR